MAQHDLNYSLIGCNGIKSFIRAIQNKPPELLQVFIESLIKDPIKLFDKTSIPDHKELANLKNTMKNLTLWKTFRNCSNIREKYPNFIGEIYAEFNPKQYRKNLGQFYTPQQIANNIGIGLKFNSIYDPCCGVGSLVLGTSIVYSSTKRYVNDLPELKFWYMLNALYYGVEFLPYNNSIIELMVLNPPFNARIFNENGKSINIIQYFLEIATKKANYLYFIVPTTFTLDNKKTIKMYEYLTKHFWIQEVNNLPIDTFDWYGCKIDTKILYCKNKIKLD